MIIDNYSLKLNSTHDLLQYSKTEESLVSWRGGQDARVAAYNNPVNVQLSPSARRQIETGFAQDPVGEAVKLSLSQNALKQLVPKAVQAPSLGTDDNSYLSDEDKLKLKIIEELLVRITGKRIKLKNIDTSKMRADVEKAAQSIQKALQGQGVPLGASSAGQPNLVGWGLDYNYKETNYEEEKLSFDAKGLVKTSDGREISLSVSLRMSRQFMSEESLSIKAGDALIDPLVINLDGSGASLSGSKFAFDIDSDGQAEQISNLSSGNAYLALDKNGDGQINNGSELFGPNSGSGFAELAQYDGDGNKWIDEKDAVYDKLRVWSRNEDGTQSLIALGQAGLGAIYLGSASTEFSLTDGASKQAQLRESGIYIREDGSAGILQELDHAVSDEA
ncbi:MAG: hypothetical protein A2X49_06450 [Lentisphaerae bacterium GWF2_52_8]|nr:MAG: hypothetical protein A2X49_06450 [Lentisphaerae bacterium GWF2_52_8]